MENMREREVLARRAPAAAPAAGKKYRGVTYLKSGKCSAVITEPGTKKKLWLGTYPSAEVAACAYDLAAKRLQGDRAKTNFDYPPPYELIVAAAEATRPSRRGPVHHAPPPPAPPVAAPPAAPAPPPSPFQPAPDFSFKAPPREPAQFPVFPFLQDPSRLVLRTPAPAPEPEHTCKITIVRSTPPKPFSFPAAVAASHRVSDPVGLFAPPIHIVVPEPGPVPASPAESCLSSTPGPKLTASASSSRGTASNGIHLMLKTPKVFAFDRSKIFSGPTTPAPGPSDEGFTGDNFTGVNVPFYFTPPLDAGGAHEASGSRRDGGWLDCNREIKKEE